MNNQSNTKKKHRILTILKVIEVVMWIAIVILIIWFKMTTTIECPSLETLQAMQTTGENIINLSLNVTI